jgi:hypothetical protein
MEKMADTVVLLAETVSKLTMNVSKNIDQQAASAGSNESRRKPGSNANPDGVSYSNAKRSLQKKRSALLKLFDINADSAFRWEAEFPDTQDARDRIDKIRSEYSETFPRLIRGIRIAEEKVISRKVDPANGPAQPLQVIPKYFDEPERSGDADQGASNW